MWSASSGGCRVMNKRLSTVDELHLSEWIRDGDLVTWGQACAEPVPLTAELMAQREAIGRFRVFVGLGIEQTIRPEHADRVTTLSYTGSGPNAALSRAGLLEVLPSHYSDYPRLIASGRLPVDVVLVQVSPADHLGRHSLSLGDEWLSSALDRARVVIAEVNEQAPWTHSRLLTEAEIDVIVETARPPVELRRRESGAVERRIAEHVRELVPDGATLQMGLGSLPEAVLGALDGHRELGVHSGAIGDGVAELMEAGIITNARKRCDVGCTVAGSLMGTERLFRFADRNPLIQVRDTRHTHDPVRLAAQTKFVAINSAFEVDLTGQVNAEVSGGRYRGAVGGSMDFLRGAARSPGGLPIVALPARAGERGRIVAALSGPVSTPRADVGIVVTEFGAADLRGLTLRGRQRRMLEIAHPDDREQLERAAAERQPSVGADGDSR
jgi:acyl-CoA hydrolase